MLYRAILSQFFLQLQDPSYTALSDAKPSQTGSEHPSQVPVRAQRSQRPRLPQCCCRSLRLGREKPGKFCSAPGREQQGWGHHRKELTWEKPWQPQVGRAVRRCRLRYCSPRCPPHSLPPSPTHLFALALPAAERHGSGAQGPSRSSLGPVATWGSCLGPHAWRGIVTCVRNESERQLLALREENAG